MDFFRFIKVCALCGALLGAEIPPNHEPHICAKPLLTQELRHIDRDHLPERPINPSLIRTIDVAPVYTTGTSTSTGFINPLK